MHKLRGFSLIAVWAYSAAACAQDLPNRCCARYITPTPLECSSFYLGLGAGTNILRYNFLVLEPGPTAESKLFGQGILGRTVAGYKGVFNHQLSLGLEAFADYTDQTMNPVRIYGGSGGSRDVQLQNTWDAGIGMLPGALLSPNSLVFMRLGALNSHFEAHIVGTGRFHFDQSHWGAQIGVGGETVIPGTQKFSLRGEYIYTSYAAWDRIGAFLCTKGDHDNANIKIINNMFQLTLIYHC